MTAVISRCGMYRYRLEREVQAHGLVFAYFGINGSTATATEDDHTVRKWIGFTQRNDGRRFIVGNAFAFRATDVAELGRADDPVGPYNDRHLRAIIAHADVLVPCWGSRAKLPVRLHARLDALRDRLLASGKPVRVFGLAQSGDPLHPLMLGYDTPLVDWRG
ncbi:DUF1643 domain-containing protein [Massilia arenosa]|uniref:DUF1643 domain-containing protein n=1 Tax=Zemynaea arenosa TaxID=2561931 RepID=A0A4Y9RX08_9BURK|nr:DUF1643 domain-containing protein [Massilia arenosa]TFW13680.1 DUF1643 domain-containing protein [Massilia arenosa]